MIFLLIIFKSYQKMLFRLLIFRKYFNHQPRSLTLHSLLTYYEIWLHWILISIGLIVPEIYAVPRGWHLYKATLRKQIDGCVRHISIGFFFVKIFTSLSFFLTCKDVTVLCKTNKYRSKIKVTLLHHVNNRTFKHLSVIGSRQ